MYSDGAAAKLPGAAPQLCGGKHRGPEHAARALPGLRRRAGQGCRAGAVTGLEPGGKVPRPSPGTRHVGQPAPMEEQEGFRKRLNGTPRATAGLGRHCSAGLALRGAPGAGGRATDPKPEI